MKRYIKQKVLSWTDHFTVKDEQGNDRYTVEGEIFSLGKKLHILDMTGQEIAEIKEEPFSFMPRYQVWVDGQQAALITKKMTFLRSKYEISGLQWQITGDLWGHDYQISRNGVPVVTIRKEWMTWGDSYELEITDPKDEHIAIAVVLAIDTDLDRQNNG